MDETKTMVVEGLARIRALLDCASDAIECDARDVGEIEHFINNARQVAVSLGTALAGGEDGGSERFEAQTLRQLREGAIEELEAAKKEKAAAARKRRADRRAAIRTVYDSLGMKRVRGSLGGTYYE